MKAVRNALVLATVFVSVTVCVSQTKSDTPKIIEVITEQGPAPAGSGLEALLLKLKTQQNAGDLRWIGGTVIAGDLNRTVAIFKHPNYASLEQSNQAVHTAWESLPAAQRPALQSQVYEFTPEQTYNDGHVPWSEARAFVLYSVLLNAGGYDDYAEHQHIAAEYVAKAKIENEEWLGFSQHFGSHDPAYILVTPMRSISDLDIVVDHSNVLPGWVDRLRATVLQKAIMSSSTTLVVVRPELGSAAR
jgi:hypothetical protein